MKKWFISKLCYGEKYYGFCEKGNYFLVPGLEWNLSESDFCSLGWEHFSSARFQLAIVAIAEESFQKGIQQWNFGSASWLFLMTQNFCSVFHLIRQLGKNTTKTNVTFILSRGNAISDKHILVYIYVALQKQ